MWVTTYLRDPRWATRSCRDCRDWLTNDDGTWFMRGGKRMRRLSLGMKDQTVNPPCFKCPKIPHDAEVKESRYAVELTPEIQQAYQYWKECKAVGDWPRDNDGRVDPIVRRTAAIMDDVLSMIQDAREAATMGMLTGLGFLKEASRGRS